MRLPEAGARVGEQDDHVGAVAKRLDGENAAFDRFHGVQRIADDVEEHLHQLISIPANPGQDRFELRFNARLGTQVQPAKLHRIVHHGIDIQKRAFGRHLTRETQQIPHQSSCAARLVADFCGGSACFFRHRRIVGQQVGKSQDRRERIIDFVRRPRCKLAQRNQLF